MQQPPDEPAVPEPPATEPPATEPSGRPQRPPALLSVRPVFDQGLAVIESLAAALAGAVVMTFLGATVFFLLVTFLGLGGLIGAGAIYSTFFVLGAALSPAIYFEVKKAAFRRTVYHFHPDHLEYQDFRFFLQRRRGRVRLLDITDVFERASPLQARRALTSVVLAVPSFPALAMPGLRGLRILDVPESADLREKIIALIEDSARRHYQPAVVAAATG